MSDLRIALLSMLEPSAVGNAYPRAFLRIAGASLAQHQLGLALALKCHRVICLAHDSSPELVALQHTAEAADVQFSIAQGPHQVASRITAKDEVFAVTDGLFVDPDSAVPLLEQAQAIVLVQPIETGLEAGFERIDLNRAAAGLMRIPGALVDRLHAMPEEADALSTLMRMALQARAEMVEVPAALRKDSSWHLVRSEAEALQVEDRWLHQQFATGSTSSPGHLAAKFAVLAFGSSLLQVGKASNVVSAAVLVCLAAAALSGWFKFAAIGFVFAGVGWILVESGRPLRLAERRPLGEVLPAIERADALLILVDVILAALVLSASPRLTGESVQTWLFAPSALFLTLWVASRVLERPLLSWISDRALLAIVLAVAALFGQALLVVQGLVLLVLAAMLVLAKASRV